MVLLWFYVHVLPFWENLSFEVVHIIGSMLLALIVTPFSTMMTLFGAITIGQLASKYRALMGILAYFGVSVINGVVSYIISFLMNLNHHCTNFRIKVHPIADF